MFKIPGSDKSIDSDLTIYDVDKSVISTADSSTNVDIVMFGIHKTVNRQWLYFVAQVGILDKSDMDRIMFTDCTTEYKLPDRYTKYVWYKTPKYYGSDRKYRVVPRFPTVAVTSDGVVYSIQRRCVLHQVETGDGYYTVSVYDNVRQKYVSARVHRLVANAWVKNPYPYEYLIVNHLDSNRKNNKASNLEWCTYRRNMQHAVEKGGHDQNIRCRLRDIETGNILEFISINAMYTHFNQNQRDVLHLKNRRINALIFDKYELRLDGDNRPWFYTSEVFNVEPSRYILTVTNPDGSRIIFNGQRSFRRYYKLWNIANTMPNITMTFKRRYPDHKLSVKDQRPTRQLEVRNIKTGEIQLFDNDRQVSSSLNISRTLIRFSVKCKGRREANGYQIRYKSSKPWPNVDIDRMYVRQQVIVTNTVTGETSIYPSLKATARQFNVVKSTIKRWCNSDKIYYEHKFMYYE